MNLHTPVIDPLVTSQFGFRTMGGQKAFHNGINYVSRSGDTRVFAIGHGTIITSIETCPPILDHIQKSPWSGNVVAIEHLIDQKRYYALYIHLLSSNLPEGQMVHPGYELGQYAEAGAEVLGPHLHLTILNEQGHAIDPSPLLQKHGIPVRMAVA